MRTVGFFTLLAALCFSFASRASADWPAVVAHDDETEVRGLPAISGDGRTLAVLRWEVEPSEAERIAVVFLDTRTGASTGEWLVAQRDADRHLLPLPEDERGETPWRRARNLTLHFAARGFRPLTPLVGDAESGVIVEGAGLRLAQPRAEDEVVVTDARGHERLRVRLPLMTSYCGMSDDAPVEAPPVVLDAQVDLRTRTLLLSYGHTYASCMCDDDVETDVLRLAP